MGQMDQRERAWYRRPISTAWGMTAAGVVLLLFVIDAVCRPQSTIPLRTATMSNIKQLATALRTYAADNDGRLPANFSTNEDIRAALASYDLDERIFETRNPDGGEILPNSELAGVELSAVVNPESTVLIYESKEWANGRFIISAVNTSTKSVDDRDQLNFDPGTIESETVD